MQAQKCPRWCSWLHLAIPKIRSQLAPLGPDFNTKQMHQKYASGLSALRLLWIVQSQFSSACDVPGMDALGAAHEKFKVYSFQLPAIPQAMQRAKEAPVSYK